MSLKALCFLLIVLTSFVTSSTASDFEWRHALNLQAQSDPYRYRYGLMQRFGTDESQVITILSRVYEPSDAYMVFRLAELSGYSSEEVLRIYGFNLIPLPEKLNTSLVVSEKPDMERLSKKAPAHARICGTTCPST